MNTLCDNHWCPNCEREMCSHSEILEQLRAADELAKAAKLVDKRCLKYGILTEKQVCSDIVSWKGEEDLSCNNCKCIKRLTTYESARGKR